MQRAIIAGLGFLAVLLALFVMVPVAPVSKQIGAYAGDYSMAYRDERPYKSGLRIAVEGRLKWLGL